MLKLCPTCLEAFSTTQSNYTVPKAELMVHFPFITGVLLKSKAAYYMYVPESSTDGLRGVGEILSLRGRGSNPKGQGEVKNLNYQRHLCHRERRIV